MKQKWEILYWQTFKEMQNTFYLSSSYLAWLDNEMAKIVTALETWPKILRSVLRYIVLSVSFAVLTSQSRPNCKGCESFSLNYKSVETLLFCLKKGVCVCVCGGVFALSMTRVCPLVLLCCTRNTHQFHLSPASDNELGVSVMFRQWIRRRRRKGGGAGSSVDTESALSALLVG